MNVLFVVMPFYAARPALGVSLLQAHLDRMGVRSSVEYFNVKLAARLGERAYHYIAEDIPSTTLAGEWVFAPCVRGGSAAPTDEYLRTIVERYPGRGVQPSSLSSLVRAREMAGPFLDNCLIDVNWQSYDLVGFTSTFCQNLASLALAQRLKERYPHLQIVFGGANCEAEMGLQLHRSFPFLDFVATGEADISFPQLVRAISDGDDPGTIPGIVARKDGTTHYSSLIPERVQSLDDLPYPNYDDFYKQYWDVGLKTLPPLPMETSRGCWWGEKQHCTFCGLNGLSMAYRLKSAARALDEFFALTARYGARQVFMADNILDLRYLRDFVPELKRRRNGHVVFYETKANLSRAQLSLLRDAGVLHIQPGVESFSTQTLRIMRKGTSAIQNVQVLKWCTELGIRANWNILYGFPGEEPEDCERVAALMDHLHHLPPPLGFAPIRLDRFSPYFKDPDCFGMCNVRPDRSYGFIYNLPPDEVERLAYYFEFDFADGRDPERYAGPMRDAFERWVDAAPHSALTCIDDGDKLTIEDGRRNAVHAVTVLAGAERAVYLYCDQNRSRAQIVAYASTLGQGEAWAVGLTWKLIALRLMVEVDGRYLSLAIPQGGTTQLARKIGSWLQAKVPGSSTMTASAPQGPLGEMLP